MTGGLLCDAHTGTGVPPASVAEWTLSGDGNRDFYDSEWLRAVLVACGLVVMGGVDGRGWRWDRLRMRCFVLDRDREHLHI